MVRENGEMVKAMVNLEENLLVAKDSTFWQEFICQLDWNLDLSYQTFQTSHFIKCFSMRVLTSLQYVYLWFVTCKDEQVVALSFKSTCLVW